MAKSPLVVAVGAKSTAPGNVHSADPEAFAATSLTRQRTVVSMSSIAGETAFVTATPSVASPAGISTSALPSAERTSVRAASFAPSVAASVHTLSGVVSSNDALAITGTPAAVDSTGERTANDAGSATLSRSALIQSADAVPFYLRSSSIDP